MLSSASKGSDTGDTIELESNTMSQQEISIGMVKTDDNNSAETKAVSDFGSCAAISLAAGRCFNPAFNDESNEPTSIVVTDLVSPPAPVAVVFEGIHVVESLPYPRNDAQDTSLFERQQSGYDANGSLGAIDDSVHLEESDGDVLERGIVVSSPAFTYVYEDALCGSDIVDDAPPISLGAAATSTILHPRKNEGRADIAKAGNGVTDGSVCTPSEPNKTSTHNASASLQLQYLGPASTVESLDNAVVLNLRAVDKECLTTALDKPELQGQCQKDCDEELDRSQSAMNFKSGGCSLKDSQRVSPASRARLVVKRPLLSGDDEFEVNNQSRLQDETEARLRLPLGRSSSGPLSSKSSVHYNGVVADTESQKEKENNVVLQLDEHGKLVKPTEPAKALSLAFRTLHRRQSSLNRSRSFNSSTELQTICELKPTVVGTDTVPLDNFQEGSSASGSNSTTWQVQASVTAKPDKLDTKPPRYHPSKEPQPQDGEAGIGIPTVSRTNSAENRLLQEATQYAEALGERPPRSMEEISRQIIDDDYDQFASDDDDEETEISIEGACGDDGASHEEVEDTIFIEETTMSQSNVIEEIKRESGCHTEQVLPPGTPESKMVEELLTASHGGHNLPKVLQLSGTKDDTNKSKTNNLVVEGATTDADTITQNNQMKNFMQRQLSYHTKQGKSDEYESRSRTDSADSIERWKEKNLEINNSQKGRVSASPRGSLSDIGQEKSSSLVQSSSKAEAPFLNPDAFLSLSDQPTNNFSTTEASLQQSAPLKHRNSNNIFGKYMLNPRPFGNDGKPMDDVGYVYQGIKFNPPEITKRGTQRGNFAQLHRKAWLEVSDKYHRYGKNLRLYYKEWERLGHPYQMFFDWLDSKGEAAGEPLPNLAECPRMQLDRDTVLYINDSDVQESYRLTLSVVCKGDNAGEIPDRRCVVLDCNDEPVSTGPDGWIFVLRDNCFYGARKVTEAVPAQSVAAGSDGNGQNNSMHNHRDGLTRMGSGVGNLNAIKKRFHHSSFFAGKAVTAAGIFITDEGGKLKCMYPHSGHYRPGEAHMQRLLYFVQRLGIDLNSFEVDVQQIAHVARKEKVVLQQVLVSSTQKGGEESQQKSSQPSGDKDEDASKIEGNEDGKIVKLRSKKEKCKKTDSVYLRPALHVAWFLTHKAKMLSKGVFGMIQNIRQVRAVSVQEALDAVDNGGYFLKSRIKRDRFSNHSHSHSDAIVAAALLQHHRKKSNSQSPDVRDDVTD